MDKLIRKIVAQTSLSYEKVKKVLEFVRFSNRPFSKIIQVQESNKTKEIVVKRTGLGPLKTEFGKFYLFKFKLDDEWEEYLALVKVSQLDEKGMPVFKNKENLLVRVDSGCETGQRFHDNTCECSEQLSAAMALIEKEGEGVLISIPKQDGRGKGLIFKLGTLALQEELEIDTILAATTMMQIESSGDNQTINAIDDIDCRTYTGCIAILKYFEIPTTTQINIATNNPRKGYAFKDNNYITKNQPVIIVPTEQTVKHLLAKQNFLGHQLFL